MKKTVYNVFYFDKDGKQIDQTQIDEKSAKLAWNLFKEFGHAKKKGMYIEWEKDTEDEEPRNPLAKQRSPFAPFS